MRKVVIEFTLTRAEHDLLVAAKSDAPNADRVKLMLLSDAARLLKRMGDDVLREHFERRKFERERKAWGDDVEPARAVTFPIKDGKLQPGKVIK